MLIIWSALLSSDQSYGLQELQGQSAREQQCPEAKANLYSTITFSWISPLMVKGYKYASELSVITFSHKSLAR